MFGTGPYYVTAFEAGFTWSGTTGVAAIIQYTFSTSREGGALLDTTQQVSALSAMRQWEHVANISFVQGNSSAPLTFSETNLGPTTAGLTTTFFIGPRITSSEVQVDTTISGFSPGGFGYLVMLHEIGHALGFKHPGNYSGSEQPPFLPTAEDSLDTSVMSYNEGIYANTGNQPRTPMIYDIAAIQSLYGANTAYNSGNTTYSYSGLATAETIWDGGGSDTLSAASFGSGTTLDLREGINNVSHIGQGDVWIAFGANIENASGGSAGDLIYGNNLANNITGNNGADVIDGGIGNDSLYGGSGLVDPANDSDTIFGSGGNDMIFGNGGNDFLYGGVGIFDPFDGNDTIYGGGGADQVFGNGGSDSLFGGGSGVDPNDAADTVYGGGGNDTVFGNGGDDSLYGGGSLSDPNDAADIVYGGAGNDMIFGNGGNDFLFGNEGNDTIFGGAGLDVYHFGNGSGQDVIAQFEVPGFAAGETIQIAANINGSGILSAADAVARTTYSGGNAFVDLGSGNGITILNVGTLTELAFLVQ